MPRRALRPCARPGCRALVERGRCARHQAETDARYAEAKADYDNHRPPETKGRYQSPEWRKARAEFLRTHPLCPCGEKAEAVDHVKPWRNQPDPERAFWDVGNWAPTCWRCHSRKTAKYDGGYGNPRA